MGLFVYIAVLKDIRWRWREAAGRRRARQQQQQPQLWLHGRYTAGGYRCSRPDQGWTAAAKRTVVEAWLSMVEICVNWLLMKHWTGQEGAELISVVPTQGSICWCHHGTLPFSISYFACCLLTVPHAIPFLCSTRNTCTCSISDSTFQHVAFQS